MDRHGIRGRTRALRMTCGVRTIGIDTRTNRYLAVAATSFSSAMAVKQVPIQLARGDGSFAVPCLILRAGS